MKINSKSTSETIRASCAFDTFDSPRLICLLYCFGLRSSFEEEKRQRRNRRVVGRRHPCGVKLLRTPRLEAQHLREDEPGRRSATKLILEIEIAGRLTGAVADDEAIRRTPIDERTMGLPARSGRPSRGYRPRGFRLVSLNGAK